MTSRLSSCFSVESVTVEMVSLWSTSYDDCSITLRNIASTALRDIRHT